MNLIEKYLGEAVKPKLKKISEDEYEVLVNGKVIGKVAPTWKNPGGNGWAITGNKGWYKSRKAAVDALIKKQ